MSARMKKRGKRSRSQPGRGGGQPVAERQKTADRPGSAPASDRYRVFYLVLFGLVSVALFDAFSVDKHLSADGVHYFVRILDTATFLQVDDARRFAEYVIQWPLVLAVKAGVSHVPALSWIFALGIYLPYLLTFAVCLFAVRRENPALLSLPLLSMVCVNLPADYILAGEHHIMILLASPILLLILRREPATRIDGFLLVLLLVAFTRTYPTAVVPALLFVVLLAIRLYSDRSDVQAAVIRGLALTLLIATVVVGAYSILNPRVAENQHFFRITMPMVFWHVETLFPAAFSGFFLLGLVNRWRIWPVLSTACLGLYVPYVFRADHGLTALESFSARTLTVSLLPPLLLLVAAVHYRDSALAGFRKAILAVMILTAVVWNLRMSSHWGGYRDEMVRVLRTESGLVPLATTKLDRNPCRWGWTSPELSVVWSYPVVRAIVQNRPNEPTVPFDPHRRLILKRYVMYGAVFAGVDPNARIVPAQ